MLTLLHFQVHLPDGRLRRQALPRLAGCHATLYWQEARNTRQVCQGDVVRGNICI